MAMRLHIVTFPKFLMSISFEKRDVCAGSTPRLVSAPPILMRNAESGDRRLWVQNPPRQPCHSLPGWMCSEPCYMPLSTTIGKSAKRLQKNLAISQIDGFGQKRRPPTIGHIKGGNYKEADSRSAITVLVESRFSMKIVLTPFAYAKRWENYQKPTAAFDCQDEASV
jgi:hypothetical protein